MRINKRKKEAKLTQAGCPQSHAVVTASITMHETRVERCVCVCVRAQADGGWRRIETRTVYFQRNQLAPLPGGSWYVPVAVKGTEVIHISRSSKIPGQNKQIFHHQPLHAPIALRKPALAPACPRPVSVCRAGSAFLLTRGWGAPLSGQHLHPAPPGFTWPLSALSPDWGAWSAGHVARRLPAWLQPPSQLVALGCEPEPWLSGPNANGSAVLGA